MTKYFCFLALFLVFSKTTFGQVQQVSAQYDQSRIKLGGQFFIKITIRNTERYEVEDFPEINGMVKTGVAVSHFSNNNKIVHTVVQNYSIIEKKSINIKPYSLIINGEKEYFNGFVKNLEVEETPESDVPDLEYNIEETLFYMSVSKQEVFVGEGVKVTLGFYISENDTAPWEFPNDLGAQIETMFDKTKSKDFLISRLNITNIENSLIKVNGKNYTFYKLLEAVYYPLIKTDLSLPSVKLKMDKGPGISELFYSSPKIVKVKDLPEHPLKNLVPVGDYSLEEKVQSENINTGKTFNYSFEVKGNGSFTGIKPLEIINKNHLDFFPPRVIEELIPGRTYGSKTFEYKVFPKDSGSFQLKDYASLVFFNTKKVKYDTLSPKIVLNITGDSFDGLRESKQDIYDGIEDLDSSNKNINYNQIIKIGSNIILCLMLVGLLTIFVITKR